MWDWEAWEMGVASSVSGCGPKGTIIKPLDGGTLATLRPPWVNLESMRLRCGGGERNKHRGVGGCSFILVAPLFVIGRRTTGQAQPQNPMPPEATHVQMQWERKDGTGK
jgi:hypothetical protein